MLFSSRETNHREYSRPGPKEQLGIVSTFILVIIFAAFYSLTKTVSDLAAEVDALQRQLKDQKEDLQSYKLKNKETQMVVFTARVKPSYQDIAPWSTIVFSDVETNIGNAYNPTNGEFTAPRAGTYVFFGHVLSASRKEIETVLTINGDQKLWFYAAGASTYHGSGSNLLAVHLNTGDKVRMLKHGPYGTQPFYIHNVFSTFSGFLLRADE